MSDNEKKEMLEKDKAVFEQELCNRELEQVAGGKDSNVPDNCKSFFCSTGLHLREDSEGGPRNELRSEREPNHSCHIDLCQGNPLFAEETR